jgi:ribosomal protein S27E
MKNSTKLILINSTRPTSHKGYSCTVEVKPAVLGKDMGLPNQLSYQVRGYSEVYVMKVNYSDGAYCGEVLVGLSYNKNTFIAEHVSANGNSWTMTFALDTNSKGSHFTVYQNKNAYLAIEDNLSSFVKLKCSACDADIYHNEDNIMYRCPICGKAF